VNVYPNAGELSIQLRGQIIPPILPTLVFKFQKKGECSMIRSEITTSCDFGRMENTENCFGFYQDNITISLSCVDENPNPATVTEPQAQNAEVVKKIMTDTSTTINNSRHHIGLEIGAVATPHPIHVEGTYGYTSSGGTNFTQRSNHDVFFR